MTAPRGGVAVALVFAAVFTAVINGAGSNPDGLDGPPPGVELAFGPPVAPDDPLGHDGPRPDNEGGGQEPMLSTEAAIACGTVEAAIEAHRRGDVATVEEAVYAAYPYATSAAEPALVELGAGLLDALAGPRVGSSLEAFLTACTTAGHVR